MSMDLERRIIELERQITGMQMMILRQPAAIAGPLVAHEITLSGTPFNLGDVVKCVAGVWTYCTSADTGPLVIGVVSETNTASCTINVQGERVAAGTAGAIYWAPDTGGNAASSPSVAGWWRVAEKQITPTIRMVCANEFGWMPRSVDACITPMGGSPGLQSIELALFSNV